MLRKKIKKVKIYKTLQEILGRYYRVVFFNDNKTVQVALLPRSEIKANKTFRLDGERYIFDNNAVYYLDGIPHIFYKRGVETPFTIEASEKPHPQWDAQLLDTVLKLDYGIKMLGQEKTLNYIMLFAIAMIVMFALVFIIKGG